jgi:hypothetical protein
MPARASESSGSRSGGTKRKRQKLAEDPSGSKDDRFAEFLEENEEFEGGEASEDDEDDAPSQSDNEGRPAPAPANAVDLYDEVLNGVPEPGQRRENSLLENLSTFNSKADKAG